jgi:hypothetical protein
MNKTQMNKLIEAVKEGLSDFADGQELVPAPNQDELRFPECPTWNTKGKGYYDFHIVYWTSRDSYANHGSRRVSMPSKDRWATFQVTHEMGVGEVTKTSTVTIKDKVINITTTVTVDNGTYSNSVGMYMHQVEMTEIWSKTDWYTLFVNAITRGV